MIELSKMWQPILLDVYLLSSLDEFPVCVICISLHSRAVRENEHMGGEFSFKL